MQNSCIRFVLVPIFIFSTGCAGEPEDAPEDCVPAGELCDGRDNDCDGETDEDFQIGLPCQVGVGACSATGETVCGEDHLSTPCDATPGEGEPESCDGVDNDCDGDTDEDVPDCCTPGERVACGVDEGICTAGFVTCTESFTWTRCLEEGGAPAITAAAEELCNGLDDTCDGMTDEGFLVGAACNVGIGACSQSGLIVCAESGEETECNVEPLDSEDEACDGVDNDCDGVTDEGEGGGALVETCTPTYTAGACSGAYGTATCVDGSLGECISDRPPEDELCDGIDNDCDGETDEPPVCN